MEHDNKSNAAFLFKQIQIKFGKNCNHDLDKLGLTHSQAHTLMFLIRSQNKEINQKDIEKEFGLSNPTVTGILKRLEAKGFITRTVSAADNRYKTIGITQKSRDIEAKVKKNIEKAQNKLFENLTDEEILFITEIFKKMLDNIDNKQYTQEEKYAQNT